MKSAAWAGPASLLAAAVLLQWGALDRQEEVIEEARTARLNELPATSMLPAYIASLFLGSFRAIAIDAAWIELERVEREQRIYRKKEILEFIKFLQPRNEEVHVLLAWNTLFNLAATVHPKDRWQWEKLGLKFHVDAVRTIPGSPYLFDELGLQLWKKAQPTSGTLDERFIEAFRSDEEIQSLYRGISGASGRALTPMEFGILFEARAKILLQQYPRYTYRSPMGRLLSPDFNDSMARDMHFIQAMYMLRRRDLEGARRWLEKAEMFCVDVMRQYGFDREPGSIYHKYLKFYPAVRQAIGIEFTGTPRQILDSYMRLLREFGTLDERFLFNTARRHKIDLGGDGFELNDREVDCFPIALGRGVEANLWPADDVDWYILSDPMSEEGRFLPHSKLLQAENAGSLPLRLRVEFDTAEGRSSSPPVEIPPHDKIQVALPYPRAALTRIVVESADPSRPDTLDSKYRLAVTVRP
jgi:hypothetical protein